MEHESETAPTSDLSRRAFLATAAVAPVLASAAEAVPIAAGTKPSPKLQGSWTINGVLQSREVEPRVTLLDLLREQLHATGTKKGCDHGQCGACTVIINGERRLSCLTLAITQTGSTITTVEGLARDTEALHPMQAAFIELDGFQCGFCTSGQICSAVALLDEVRKGIPSSVTRDLSQLSPVVLTDAEIRERMSGNICRCGAYPNIVAAIRSVHDARSSGSI